MKIIETKQVKIDILERTEDYALSIIDLFRIIENDSVGKILGRQLLKAGTSVGANIEEAQGAQSKADFISKMSIAYKEVREASFWIRLIRKTILIPTTQAEKLLEETIEIAKILASILISSKQ